MQKKIIKPAGWFWLERKRLAKIYKCKIDTRAKTIYIQWQIAEGATEVRKFATKYKFQIQQTL